MKHLYHGFVALGILSMIAPVVTLAQDDAKTCDIRINSISMPTQTSSHVISPLLTHPVALNLGNGGTAPVDGATVVVSLDDSELFTETINKSIENGWKATLDTLTNKVTFTPGKKQTLTVKLLPPAGYTDTKDTDNTKSQEYIIPALGAYPYKWDAATVEEMFIPTGGYVYNATEKAFVCNSSSRWNSFHLLTKSIDMPSGHTAKLTFKYKAVAAGDITFDLTAVGLESEESVGTIKLQTGTDDYVSAAIPFVGNGKTVFKLHAQPAVQRGNTLTLSDISIVADEPDMSCDAILYPASSNFAIGIPINVSARFTNPTGLKIIKPKVSYTFGDNVKVEEQIEDTIAPGASYDYTFTTPLTVTEESSGTLTVSCLYSTDTNPDNNTRSIALNFYAPISFPYITDFSKFEGWSIIDADDNDVTWTHTKLTGDIDNGVLAYPRFMSDPKDYAYTPAIDLPAGRSRVSFYIGGRIGSKVNVLMGKSMNPAEMTVIATGEIKIDGWMTVANVFDVPEAGVYYFAFDCVTSKGEIIIDNLYIDRGNDLAVNDITFDTESGFKKTTSKVTMSVNNFGIDPQSNITIAYYVNDGTDDNLIKCAEAVITDVIQPGATYYHTFDKPLDISVPDRVYTLVGEIVTKVGADTQNDRSLGQSIAHYPTQQIPYYNGFEDPARNSQWSMLTTQGSNAWVTAQQYGNTYEGNFILGHTSTNAQADADDWAFSECIHIPAGTYEFSMFYRTFKNQTAEKYAQNFKVMLGSDATPSAMTQTLVAKENVIVAGSTHEKYLTTITVEKDGDYYLGFYSNSPVGLGVTYIDAVSIAPITKAVDCPYEANFATAVDEWDVYYTTMQSWTYSADDNAMILNRNAYYAAMVGSAGWLVSPRLKFEAGQNYEVTFEYTLTGNEADAPALGVYVAPINNPSEFTLVHSLAPTTEVVKAHCIIPAIDNGGERYVAIRPTMESTKNAYTASVKSFRVARLTTTSIDGITDSAPDVVETGRFDISGRKVSGDYKGIVIVRMSNGSVRKELVK